MKDRKQFDITKSPIKEAYTLLGAKNPGELSTSYTKEDQKLIKAELWDYKNSKLITNKIKKILEKIDGKRLTKEELYWRNNILWFWYHHAVTCAIWNYNNKTIALKFANKALEFQPSKHPNKNRFCVLSPRPSRRGIRHKTPRLFFGIGMTHRSFKTHRPFFIPAASRRGFQTVLSDKITRFFYLLSNKYPEAKKWANSITIEPEKSTARKLLEVFDNLGKRKGKLNA